MIYLQLFWVYIQIGLFGFGGGYAMLSLIQNEVVYKYGWLTNQQFTDIVAVSQVTPGPIGINSATYIGYVVTGGNILGSLLATTAVMLPSFVPVSYTHLEVPLRLLRGCAPHYGLICPAKPRLLPLLCLLLT